MHDVFISYSHNDKTVADAICARFESENIRCWYAPRDIAPGADWAASIIDAIKGARLMVLIFTDYSNASEQVLREVNNAVSAGIPVVPFKMTETMPTKGMQYYLSTVHWLDAMNLPLEKSIDSLDALVRSMLSGTPMTPEQQRALTPPPKKKKTWLIPVIAASLVVLIGAGIGGYFFFGSLFDKKDTFVDTVELETEASDPLEVLTPPEGSISGITDYSNTGTQGNTQSNYQNDGMACTDGEWFFYVGNDHQSIYRMKLDGSEKSKLNDIPSKYLGIVDNYIYFYGRGNQTGIFRMRPDGTDKTLLFSGTIEDMLIKDDRIYFKNSMKSLRLYSIALDGSDMRKENDFEKLYYFALWDDRIYFSNQAEGGKLYSAKIDGTDQRKLTDTSVTRMTVVDGYLIYCESSEVKMIDLATGESRILFGGYIFRFNLCEYGFFGCDSEAFYHAPLGEVELEQLTEKACSGFSVCNGYVFYSDEDTGKNYIMKYDGTEDQML